MMNKWIYIFFLSSCLGACTTQKNGSSKDSRTDVLTQIDTTVLIQPIDSFITQASHISIDEKGFLYEIQDNKVTKRQYIKENNAIFQPVFSDKTLSSIDEFNVRSSLKPFVFNKNAQRIFILDNTLSLQHTLFLNTHFDYLDLLTSSNRTDYYWAYSPIEQKLLLIDPSLKVAQLTKNIGNFVKNDVNPISIQEEGNKLYMYDVSNGLLEFDLYGTYEKRTLLLDIQKVIVQSQLYFCLKKGRLYLYNSKNFSTVLFQLDKEIKDFTIYKNQLYILAEGKVFRYDLK